MTSRDRLGGALAALGVQALLGWLLIAGLAVSWRRTAGDSLTVFRVAPLQPLPPTEPPPPPERRSERRKDAAAPPNLRSRATDLVAPPPVLPDPTPPPAVAALTPATGAQATAGAALVAGPGTGAAGTGAGFGGGGDGDGDGGPPRLRHGRLKDQDYPQSAALAGSTGIVGVRYLVGVDGRVGECRIAHSSGSVELDTTTCRLIQQRFRFDPSRDARGRKVPAWVVESHEWVIERPPPPAP